MPSKIEKLTTTIGVGDKLSASWVLVVGSIFIAYWYWRIRPKSATAAVKRGANPSPPTDTGGGSILDRLKALALGQGFTPRSGQASSGHAHNSLHYVGRALDVPTQGHSNSQISDLWDAAVAAGFRVLNELYKGMGPYGYSSGFHLHIDQPYGAFRQAPNPFRQRAAIPSDPEHQIAQEVG